MSRRIVATIPDELAERLDAYLSVQSLAAPLAELVRAALKLWLDTRTTYRVPSWNPVCPVCGFGAEWLRGGRLGVFCPICREDGEGPYPDQEGHEIFAERWSGHAGGRLPDLRDSEREWTRGKLAELVGRLDAGCELVKLVGMQSRAARSVDGEREVATGPDRAFLVVYRDPTWQDPRPEPEAPDGQGGTE